MKGVHLWSTSIRCIAGNFLSLMTHPSNNAFNRNEALSSTTFEDLVNVDIKKPGRYIGHELGAQKHDWDNAEIATKSGLLGSLKMNV